MTLPWRVEPARAVQPSRGHNRVVAPRSTQVVPQSVTALLMKAWMAAGIVETVLPYSATISETVRISVVMQ